MLNVDIINPVHYPGWDEIVLGFPGCSIFHSSAWAKVLSETYDYKPLYFIWKKQGQIAAILPIMEIRSFLTGARGVSLPFSDLCPALTQAPAFQDSLLEEAKRYGEKKGWKHIDLRGTDVSAKPYHSYYIHHLDLVPGEQQIFTRLKSSNRRNIKKAVKEGVTACFFSSPEALKAFYRLHCTTRKNHGLPPQPFHFFRNIYDSILSKGLGFITLATHHGKTIAGALYLHFGKNAVYKFGASDPKYLHLRPNNLVMWETVRWYAGKGFEKLSFGRTDLHHHGLLRFKRDWGGDEEILDYHRYDMTKSEFTAPETKTKTSYAFMKKTPKPALRFIGNLLYRHMG